MDTTELRIDTGGRHVLDLTDRAAAFAAQAGTDGLLVCVRAPRHRRPGRDGDRVGLRGGPRGGARPPAASRRPLGPPPRQPRPRRRPPPAGVRRPLSLTVPVQAGRLLLGTWQRICLVDFNDDNPQRRVRLSFLAG